MNKLSALANPTRIKILNCLGKSSKSVSELISVCGLSQSAVSQHLSILRQVGFVKSSKNGKLVIYSLSDKQVFDVSKLLFKYI